MTGDYFTKPLQGKKFFRHRMSIMNHTVHRLKRLPMGSPLANRSVLENTHTTVRTYEVSEPRLVEGDDNDFSALGAETNNGRAMMKASRVRTADQIEAALFEDAETEWILIQRKVRAKKPKHDTNEDVNMDVVEDNAEHRVQTRGDVGGKSKSNKRVNFNI
jgi:uncharacterized protein YecA (UPF0149 family)